ncbi:MAG: IS110 family transposase [Actinoallomurus sp.]
MSLALPPARMFVVIDWATEIHAVCVMDTTGQIVAQFTIAHSADGIAMVVRRLAKLGDAADMPIGIERPNGRLVDLLLEAGHPVVVSPNAIKTWREGEVLSGAKSDAAGAAVIAESLRLRTATPYSIRTKALRAVVRGRDDLVQLRVAALHQVAALLEAYWPGGETIFAKLASQIALEFLTYYPTPVSAADPREEYVVAFCTGQGYPGKRPATVRLQRPRSARAGTTDPTLTDAVRVLARA